MNPDAADINPDTLVNQNHDLDHEFPELKDRLHELVRADQKFAEMCDTYTDLNREVIRIEQGLAARGDCYVEDAKKRRLLQKDLIYARLRE